MRMTSKLLVAVVLTALAFTPTAASGAAQPRGSNDHTTTTRSTPLTGTLEGVHTSRTPLTAPFVLDRFDMRGQATHLGQLTLVIESTVDFGVRPVTGVGTMTFVSVPQPVVQVGLSVPEPTTTLLTVSLARSFTVAV